MSPSPSADAAPLIAIVLCGGGGTRLWPISTDARPKQFIALFGEQTLFQTTISRLAKAGADEKLILTNAALREFAQADLLALGASGTRIVLEPMRRDSAPAIAAGVADILARHGPDAIVLVLASDHRVADEAAFAAAIGRGRALAERDFLVTFGIRPTYPATEYGYLQRGGAVDGVPEGFKVKSFHEKPALARAEQFFADPDFFWNSGNFMFRAGFFASEAARHMPEVWKQALLAVQAGQEEAGDLALDSAAFSAAPRISIDFALMERSNHVGMTVAAFDWSDIGNWASVHAASPQDGAGNATRGQARLLDCQNCLVMAQDMPVYAVGLDDMVVIACPTGLFVAPRSRAQEIKAMLERMPPS